MKKESPCRIGHLEKPQQASNRGNAPVQNPLCFTRFEFAESFRVSVRTVDRMIAAGEIRVRRIRGKCVRILREDVERYLEKAEG
jgi:excisionase family DNA binding protein